ncbi:helix-turn-helix domain-containing protein [Actinacidiphila guanduensis]|uniref:Helix-turn-helix domain-containing protein n=1 Tax=Actinacidiphila guanduensis TaxID=310781 RepID=A0A1G9XA21_9ACTN|nr:helix-turn-helix transcriptional regulator [Actinacidiphila guanduensis]SDM93649.1 Helix-turn-helix domain-containing protein [Actinacidiphila guanduensis]
MSAGQPGGGSIVRRMLLGAQLRRLRESQGITRETAGYSIRASESKISRMELGRVSFKERDVADLLTLYGVTEDAERLAMLGLVREANAAGWWHGYGEVMPTWFQTYVGLEESAALIRTFEVQFVHGLLQTEDYIRAVIRLGHPQAADPWVERRVGLRLERQKLLVSERAPHFVSVMDEGALHRAFGGSQVMRGQIQHILETAEAPNVDVRILPFATGGHGAGGGAFTLLSFPESDLPDLVYLEQLTGALYVDKHDEVVEYTKAMDALDRVALTPAQSLDWLRAYQREL